MPNSNEDSIPSSDLSEKELEQLLKTSPYPQTDKVHNIELSNLSGLFKVPDDNQTNYATFTESFERFKIKVDVLKWLIGTVGLTLITYIINWGFRDREQGIVELQMYDRYASETVVFAESPKNRLLLSQFFASVTPSEKLRKGWQSYLLLVEKEVQVFDETLKKRQENLEVLEKDTNDSQQARLKYIKAKEEVDELERINNLKLVDEATPIISFEKTSIEKSNENLAKEYEKKGFEQLLAKDVNKAIYFFKMSENSLNRFHMVYDIAKYLEENKSSLLGKDSKFWKEAYKQIVKQFSWRMPKETKEKLILESL